MAGVSTRRACPRFIRLAVAPDGASRGEPDRDAAADHARRLPGRPRRRSSTRAIRSRSPHAVRPPGISLTTTGGCGCADRGQAPTQLSPSGWSPRDSSACWSGASRGVRRRPTSTSFSGAGPRPAGDPAGDRRRRTSGLSTAALIPRPRVINSCRGGPRMTDAGSTTPRPCSPARRRCARPAAACGCATPPRRSACPRRRWSRPGGEAGRRGGSPARRRPRVSAGARAAAGGRRSDGADPQRDRGAREGRPLRAAGDRGRARPGGRRHRPAPVPAALALRLRADRGAAAQPAVLRRRRHGDPQGLPPRRDRRRRLRRASSPTSPTPTAAPARFEPAGAAEARAPRRRGRRRGPARRPGARCGRPTCSSG